MNDMRAVERKVDSKQIKFDCKDVQVWWKNGGSSPVTKLSASR